MVICILCWNANF